MDGSCKDAHLVSIKFLLAASLPYPGRIFFLFHLSNGSLRNQFCCHFFSWIHTHISFSGLQPLWHWGK